MSDSAKNPNKLDDLMGMYKQAEKSARAAQEQQDSESSTFLEAVSDRLNDALRPAFAEIEARYKGSGLSATVGEGKKITCDGELSAQAKVAGQATSLISMRFQLPDGWHPTNGFAVLYMPDVGFVADESKRRLVLYVTNLTGTSSQAPLAVKSLDPATLTRQVALNEIASAIAGVNRLGMR
ncbi:hypothetical protein WME90_33180 [Sorangium sp. So ce375]|uniref:hypothetical protein n=1 Tax=Sorangium sp. So ce375 TaxID=3133306 RepID=UPI003F5C27B4